MTLKYNMRFKNIFYLEILCIKKHGPLQLSKKLSINGILYPAKKDKNMKEKELKALSNFFVFFQRVKNDMACNLITCFRFEWLSHHSYFHFD